MKTVAVYPGRFHVFHRGHQAVYDHLVEKYGAQNVYVATSAKQDQKDSPFSYTDKEKMMTKMGVPPGRIIKVVNPYNIKEISQVLDLDPDQDQLIYALGAKDAQRFTYTADSALQLLNQTTKLKPVGKHAYVEVVPTATFNVLGKPIQSASEIRKMYVAGNDNQRNQIINDLYGETDAELRDMFDQALGVNAPQEGIIYGQERIYAGDQPVSVMREERLACLRENIAYLKAQIQQLRENQNYDDDIDMSRNYAMSPQGYRSMRRKQIDWAKKPASESPGARFAYQGFVIQFHPDRVEIYHGGDLVYTKSGNYGNPTAQQLATVKGRIPALVSKIKQAMKNESADYIEEKWSEKYKRSINCNNPKGFSQRAHCAGRKKK